MCVVRRTPSHCSTTQHDMLPQHLVCKYELNREYCNITLARNKAPWWWSDKVETCQSVLRCFKVFYVKLYVHSLVDKLKWPCVTYLKASFIWEISDSESVEVEYSRLWDDISDVGGVLSVVSMDRIVLVFKVQVSLDFGSSWTSRSLKIKPVQAVKQNEPLVQWHNTVF